MNIMALIGSAFKIALFFINMWMERDAEKAKKKAEIADDIVKAFKETNPRRQASRLNDAVGRINRMHR